MDTRLEKAMTTLIYERNFMVDLIYQMSVEYSSSLDTAGVSIKDNKIRLRINPKFWESLPTKEQIAVLEHECLHLLNNHIPRYLEVFENYKQMRNANIAMDLAINQYISGLPEKAITFENAKKEFPEILPKETWEYYYSFFKENVQKSEGEGDEEGNGMFSPFDDHSEWGDSDTSAETAKEIIKDAVNNAKESYESNGRGVVSSDIQSLIDALNYTPKNWKHDLRMFIARTQNIVIEQSRKVRNRRYGVIFPGERKDSVLHLALAIDTSGSVSEEELSQFGAEIDRISESVKVTVIIADSEVKEVFDYKKGDKFCISGRGGTAYQPALNKAKELEVDGLIYFGDMDVFGEELTKPKYPVLWAIVGNSEAPASWGKKTKIEVKKASINLG